MTFYRKHNFDIMYFLFVMSGWGISPNVLTVALIPFLIIPTMQSQRKRNLRRYINSTIK